ncbi:MAG: hypothetical protein CM15mP102_02620 [Flavobacteriales bacterium]|nr:MAG: hypothetical protein CM15mP102_02620 [Flavobacteriales bacterium]
MGQLYNLDLLNQPKSKLIFANLILRLLQIITLKVLKVLFKVPMYNIDLF